jgi:hypothetical protein
VGANRDEFIILRKMRDVDWMEEPLVEPTKSILAAE